MHEIYMKKALELARQAELEGEVPVGALVIYHGEIVGQGTNKRESQKSPIAHAEILAIEEAAKNLGRWRLSGCELYVTLEPCCMCAGALVNARINKLIYGAKDLKAGAIDSLYQIASDSRLNHRLTIESGILEKESSKLLKDFFVKLRT